MKLAIDYKFRDDLVKKEADTVPIELLLTPFDGIVFRFDKVRITEDAQGESARMVFDYTILDKKDFVETKLRADKTFNHTLGLILNSLILDFTDHNQGANAADDRQNHSQEFVEDQ